MRSALFICRAVEKRIIACLNKNKSVSLREFIFFNYCLVENGQGRSAIKLHLIFFSKGKYQRFNQDLKWFSIDFILVELRKASFDSVYLDNTALLLAI